MTDRLDALEAKLAELSAQLAAAQRLIDRNDDWANGTWLALLDLLLKLREHQPKLVQSLQDNWIPVALRYEARLAGAPTEEGELSTDHAEARAKLAYFLWPRSATDPSTPAGDGGTARHARPRNAAGSRAR